MSRDTPAGTHLEVKQPEQSPADQQVIAAEQKAARTSTSKGEKLFDLLTYGGIGFLGVFAAGIPIGYWAKYGKGAKLFNSTAKSIENLGITPKAAEDMVMTSVLMQPGNIGILPIKTMENNKPELVEKFNKMLGDKSADASVEKDAKQTWGSLIKSRFTAWLAVFAGFRSAAMIVGEEKFEKFSNSFAENIVCKPLGKPTHIPGMAKIVENETKLFRYGKIAALDVFATAAATILLYAGTRFFAKPNPQWHAKHLSQKDALETAPPVEPQTTSEVTTVAQPLVEPSSKLFTDSITSRSMATPLKGKSETFSESIKNSPSEPSLVLGA
jgi:hypothetical protein